MLTQQVPQAWIQALLQLQLHLCSGQAHPPLLLPAAPHLSPTQPPAAPWISSTRVQHPLTGPLYTPPSTQVLPHPSTPHQLPVRALWATRVLALLAPWV